MCLTLELAFTGLSNNGLIRRRVVPMTFFHIYTLKKSTFLLLSNLLFRVPMQCWKYWKCIDFWNRFSRPWKSIEFG